MEQAGERDGASTRGRLVERRAREVPVKAKTPDRRRLDRLDQAIARKPAIVIVELGANDGLRGLPVATTRANLEQIIAGLQKAGARIVLAGMTLPPNYGPDYIRSFQRIYPELAAKHKLALIPFLLEGVVGDTRYMQRDGLHANVEGNRRVAENAMRALAPLLER